MKFKSSDKVNRLYILEVIERFLFFLVCLDCWWIHMKIVHHENLGVSEYTLHRGFRLLLLCEYTLCCEYTFDSDLKK